MVEKKRNIKNIFIFSALNGSGWMFIDGGFIKTHQDCTHIRDSKNEAVGRSRGGKSTKIHLAVDSGGLPLYFESSGGQVNDIVHGQSLVSGAPNAKKRVADKGYDSEPFRDFVWNLGSNPVISSWGD